MKKFKKVILSAFIALFLFNCGTSKQRVSEWMRQDGKVKVLSTTAQVGSLVSEIGGERIDHLILIEGDLDPHSYEIVKGDLEKFKGADVIFYNGLGLEHGASLSEILKNSPKALGIGDEISKQHPGEILKKEGVVDPHIWMDISLWQKGVDPIVKALCKKDPDGAAEYEKRGALLKEKMDLAHREILFVLHSIPSHKRYLVTSHDAFHYFTRSYLADPNETEWERRFAAPEGLAPEGQLNSRDLQKIIDFLRTKEISVLFPESNVSRDSIRKIASAGKELGLNIRVCSEPLYGDAMGDLTYLEMMKKNAETIAKYL